MAKRKTKAVTASGRRAPPEDRAVWRLATREPILAYDEYLNDEIELEIGQRDPESIEGLLIDFRYVGRDGEFSRRSVLCWQCGRDGDRLYVRGYCAFREELRTFRVDRMSNVVAVRGDRETPVEDATTFFAAFAARQATGADSARLALPD